MARTPNKGPLRRRAALLMHGTDDRDKTLMECGHVIWADWTTDRNRCWKCKKGLPADMKTTEGRES